MIPNKIEYNNKIYNSAGMVKLNNGAFLVTEQENRLSSFDFTSIPELAQIKQIPFSKPTKVEDVFMEYYLSVMQKKVDTKELSTIADINKACININRYINEENKDLLNNMRQLDNKDHIVLERKKAILEYFAEEMSKNPYFQQPVEKVEIIEDVTAEQPINDNIPVMSTNVEVIPLNKEVTNNISNTPQTTIVTTTTAENVPKYDEKTVTDVLKTQVQLPNPNFDVNKLINRFFNNLTIEQIDLLLNNFSLNEEQINRLNQKKQTIQVFNSLEQAEMKQQSENAAVAESKTSEKRKRFTIFGDKNVENDNNKKAAFVDTLLLSFTIGTLCGVYLMYFILTIMS